MALKYVEVSGGVKTDPVSVRVATRPSTWPQIPLSSEILDDRVYLLFDATGEYCLPQFQLVFTGDVVCKMHLYKDTTLFRTDTVTLTSGSYNTTQYEASADYNYILVEISDGVITELTIAGGSNLTYDSVSSNSNTPNQLLEISGKLDDLTDCSVNNSGSLRYFGIKKSNGFYACSLIDLYSLIAVLEYKATLPKLQNCYALQTIPELDTSSVTNMNSMFKGCQSLTSIPELDTSNVTNMSNMFYGCYALQTIPQLDTSNVTNMSSMFLNCNSLKTIPQLDTSNVTNMSSMFFGCYSLTSIPELDTSNVTNMSNMFNACYSLTSIPELDTSNVTNMDSMFKGCQSLTSIPQLNTSNVTNMSGMFYNCYALQTIPQLNTSIVTNMSTMFNNCYALQTIPQLNTSIVTNMSGMFYGCYALQTIPQLDTSNVTNMSNVFNNCYKLITINGTVIRKSISLSNSKLLPHDELVEIIGNLPDLTGGTAQTLTLGSTLLAKLSADEIAVATNKNWTVA